MGWEGAVGRQGVLGPGQIISHEDPYGGPSHLSYFFIYWEKGWEKRWLGVTIGILAPPMTPSQLGGGGSEQSHVLTQVPS